MFCGWRLLFSYPDIEKRGSGVLEINVLSRSCTYDGEPIPRLTIADELHAWLVKDVAALNLSVEDLRSARLLASLTLREIPAEARRTSYKYFDSGERPSKATTYIECAIQCSSEIVTDEKVYSSAAGDFEEWPKGWRASQDPAA
jgi:hypothetical protein